MSGSQQQIATAEDFSTGNDCRLVLIFGILGTVRLKHVTGFHATQIVKQLRVARLNGTPLGADIPGGWNGTFNLDRGDSTADDLAATLESMYWNGQRLPAGQIYQYISEVNGSTSTYEFTGVTLNLKDAGNWQQESVVKQTVDFFSGRRRRL
jgi:hypothetical protein